MKVKKAAAGVGMGMGMGPGAGRERRLKQGPKQGCGMGILRRRKFKAEDGVSIDKPKLPGKSVKKTDVKMKKAKSGDSLKAVPGDKKKSLGKLPTAVRNKMGFQKDGGKSPKKMMGGGKCKYGC